MLADVVWENLTIAGAFLVGIFLGGLGAIRVMRYVLEYRRGDRHSP